MYDASDNGNSHSNKNNNNNNTLSYDADSKNLIRNSTEIYWEFAASKLAAGVALAAPEISPASHSHFTAGAGANITPQPSYQAYHHSDNQTHFQAQPPPFYTSFNISSDLFDYFNEFLVPTEQQQLATSSTEFNLTTPSSTTPEPDLSEFLEALPNDRVSLLSFLFLFSFATVFGNSLVILAVIRERYLHTATNYFITSLAVADCLVGLVVMPFSALYEVLENTWFFGTDWCDIWRSLDVLFSTASILNLCVISLDRYWAITDPFSYPMRMTVKRAAGLICAVWVCSSAISFPAIVWWRAARDGEMPAYKCTFTEHLGYLVFSSTISFYLPLLVMVFTYCRIYRAAVIQTRSLKIGTKQVLMASGELQLTLRIHRGGTTREPSSSAHHHSGGSLGGGGGGVGGGSQHHSHSHHHHSTHHNHSIAGTTTSTPEEPDDEPLSALHNNGLARHRHMGKNFSLSRKLAKFAKEKKAAKTLGIVMGVFIVCWLPFFVVNLLSGFCIECIEHEEIVSAVVTWLGWINSCMNPVIYACWSRDFRRAFVRLLCVCCPRKIRRKYQPTMRSKSQLSSCSTCSGSSNCGGRNGVHHHHGNSHQQCQQQQQQRERSCTRCQSFHRHHHRQRRRSSGMHQLRNDLTVTSAATACIASGITRAIVNITPSDTGTTPRTVSTTLASGSTLTVSSMPSLVLGGAGGGGGHSPTGSVTPAITTPMSASAVPLHTPSTTKHCTFALIPTTIPPPPNQVSFLATARYHPSLRKRMSPNQTPTAVTPVPTPTSINASSISLADLAAKPMPNTIVVGHHPTLEMRQSAQSEMTTVEDDYDDIVEAASPSSSVSSLGQHAEN